MGWARLPDLVAQIQTYRQHATVSLASVQQGDGLPSSLAVGKFFRAAILLLQHPREDKVVSIWCSLISGNGICDISVTTAEAFSKRGFATLVTAAFIDKLRCERRNLCVAL